jgi:hypothetical protein
MADLRETGSGCSKGRGWLTERVLVQWDLGPAGLGLPRQQGASFVLQTTRSKSRETLRFKLSYVPQSGSHHRQTRTMLKTAGAGKGYGAHQQGRDPARGWEGGDAEPCRNVTFESMLFSSHLRCSMRKRLLRPAVPLMDLHFLRRDGVAAIQESGTRTSGLNNDTKSSECLHTQLPKQTRQVQLGAISPHSGA